MSIKEKKIWEKSLGKNVSISTVFAVVLLAFALSWFADGVAEFIPAAFKGLLMLVVSIAIFITVFFRVRQLNKRYAKEDDIDIKQQKSKPKRALVLSLSYYDKPEVLSNIDNIKMTNIGKNKRDENLKGWQMPLEAIWFHLSRLESLVILTSKETDSQYDEFVNLLERVFNKKINIVKVCIDINSLDDIKKGYHETAQMIADYKDSEVVYDITSGSKLSTIAGSFFALNSDRLIEYIDTTTYEMKMYNNNYLYNE